MFKRVDESQEGLEGFSYMSADGIAEVRLGGGFIRICDSCDAEVTVMVEDIENLIKALQAAEDYFKENVIGR